MILAIVTSAARRAGPPLVASGVAATLLLGGAGASLPASSSPAGWSVPVAAAAGLEVPAAEAQFLDLLNADRLANGLDPLQPDPRLMDLARWRSEDMVARNYFSHDIGGFNVFQVMSDRQIGFQLAGENIAYNTYDAGQTVPGAESSLMNSPAHRANILQPEFNLVGVGIALGSDQKTVFTQVFAQG